MTGWEAVAAAVRDLDGRDGFDIGDLYIDATRAHAAPGQARGPLRWWALFEPGPNRPSMYDLHPGGRWLDLNDDARPGADGFFDDAAGLLAALRLSAGRLGPCVVSDLEDFTYDPEEPRP
jgi:hypothetical protein